MSNIIVNPKNYTGHELETIFFRPLLSGPTAEQLGIRILYNMPMPTKKISSYFYDTCSLVHLYVEDDLCPF